MTEQSQRILYVDDDSSLRDEISLFVPGYKISACETISDGIALATQAKLCLIPFESQSPRWFRL